MKYLLALMFIAFFSMLNAVKAQEFFCSVRSQIGFFPENGNWRGSSNIKIPDYLKNGFIIRPPNSEDIKNINLLNRGMGWETHPYIVRLVGPPSYVSNSCDRGFSDRGYLFCDTIGDLVFNFNTRRFRDSDKGTYLNGPFDGQDYADVFSYGECVLR